jgi:flagellar FliL protein
MVRVMSGKPSGGKADKPEEPPVGGDAEQSASKKKKPGKKKLILLAAPLLLLAGGGAGLWFSGILPGLLGLGHKEAAAKEALQPAVPIFVDLPDMIANLASPNTSKPYYVKLQARLEISKPDDADKVKQSMPRLQDLFQTYLREMRPEELRGSAGTYRLREELLGRANVALAPTRVNDVLFTQLLIQ